jgi:F0F1-type ATP synthase membrane subunit b/b'
MNLVICAVMMPIIGIWNIFLFILDMIIAVIVFIAVMIFGVDFTEGYLDSKIKEIDRKIKEEERKDAD